MERKYYWTLPPVQEFEKMVFCTYELVEETVSKNEIVNPKRIYQHEIFMKYVFHINTLLSIINGTNFNMGNISTRYLDYPSIITLLRTSLETFLTYYFIFVDPKTEDEHIFRYNNWFIDGLNQRQKLDVSFNDTLIEIQKSELDKMNECIKILKSTKAYLELNQKQKNKLDRDKMFIRPGWSEIFKLTGITEYWSKTFYSYFCSYAHSTSSCIIQFQSARNDQYSGKILMMCIHFSLIITSMFIDRYCIDFKVGDKLPIQRKECIEAWIYLGKNLTNPNI